MPQDAFKAVPKVSGWLSINQTRRARIQKMISGRRRWWNNHRFTPQTTRWPHGTLNLSLSAPRSGKPTRRKLGNARPQVSLETKTAP
jgi:hypothetical protein